SFKYMSHHFVKYSNVYYRYDDGTEALKGVDFMVTHGERVALFGLNGSGKSTLMLLTDALIFPTEGEVNVGDVPVTKKTAESIRRSVGFVFQDPDDMLFMPTIYDDIAFGPRNMKLPEEEVVRRVEAALQAVGLKGMEKKAAFQLSGGQRRSAAIASVLAMEPDILILDEPSANLDALSRRNLINILKEFRHTIILATHDIEMAQELCQRAVILEKGVVAADKAMNECNDDLFQKFGLR
ncbi:MAG: energy-coupling factor ABC transporter ATP-binding protein, partial [Muribaculaceae bacterium]|nr:energy-coupling factor ABC transporter ATP-binding protein [Muribaculaceae bacterium]